MTLPISRATHVITAPIKQTKESIVNEALQMVDRVWAYTHLPIVPYEYKSLEQSFDFSDRLDSNGCIIIPFKTFREHLLKDDDVRFLMKMNIRWAIEIFSIDDLHENHNGASDASLLYLYAAKMTEDFIRVHNDEYIGTRLFYYKQLGMDNSVKFLIGMFRISSAHNTMDFEDTEWIACLELLSNLVIATTPSLTANHYMRDVLSFKDTEFEYELHDTIINLLEMIFTANL